MRMVRCSRSESVNRKQQQQYFYHTLLLWPRLFLKTCIREVKKTSKSKLFWKHLRPQQNKPRHREQAARPGTMLTMNIKKTVNPLRQPARGWW